MTPAQFSEEQRSSQELSLNEYVYLDYAATAPLCQEAADAMAPYLVPGVSAALPGGNANSLHSPGRSAFKALEDARRLVARSIDARRPDEVVFTSGATEADNAALFGLAYAVLQKRRQAGGKRSCSGALAGRSTSSNDGSQKGFLGHIITSAIEHEAVLQPAKQLEKEGFCVTFLPCDEAGFIQPETLRAALSVDTLLVSIQAANSEVGSIQPIKELAEITHQFGALFHTDAVQAFGKIPFSVQDLGVDAASFSAHKIGGPKGIGALYLRARTPFQASMLGGGQETGRRSGTQNVAGAAAFAAAAQATVALQEQETQRLAMLRRLLIKRLKPINRVHLTLSNCLDNERYLCSLVHVLVDKMESETLILRLDEAGFGVSGGSACASHSLEPSSVLRALGVSTDAARGALRITMGRYTTESDIEQFVTALKHVIY